MDPANFETLFRLAIEAERKGEELYLRLAERFAHLPRVSEFWRQMTDDERQHIRELEDVFNSLKNEERTSPADPSMVEKARKVTGYSVAHTLGFIKTLEDAYQEAHEFEHAEVNELFSYLLRSFLPPDRWKTIVAAQVKNHLLKLMEFSMEFDRGRREGIRALEG